MGSNRSQKPQPETGGCSSLRPPSHSPAATRAPHLSRQAGHTLSHPLGDAGRASATNGEATLRNTAAIPAGVHPSTQRAAVFPGPLWHCAISPENRTGLPGQQEEFGVVMGRASHPERRAFPEEKSAQHLRSWALGIPSRGAGSKANQQRQSREEVGGSSSGTACRGRVFHGPMAYEKLPRRE